jgi:hypothetical protein
MPKGVHSYQKIESISAKIPNDNSLRPVVQATHWIPFNIRDDLKKIEELLEARITESGRTFSMGILSTSDPEEECKLATVY